jgi:hypothetical protein
MTAAIKLLYALLDGTIAEVLDLIGYHHGFVELHAERLVIGENDYAPQVLHRYHIGR